jgi:L-ascorbate metabolism protein UlaG (beta-lactamase superfamily)
MRVTYVGHATVLIEHLGMRLLTDPVMRSRIGHLRRYGSPPSPTLTNGLDAVLLSHLHGDHLDRPSLRAIADGTAILAPKGSASLIRRDGHSLIHELVPGDTIELRPGTDESGVEPQGIRIRATEAEHEGRRVPFGPSTATLGFEITGEGRRLYFAGDTELFPGLADLSADGAAPLDLALLPIWGWGPTLGPGHLDPESAARAVAMLKPRLVIPIHWGTFFPLGLGRWSARHLKEPPQRFCAYVSEHSPDTEVRVLEPGSSLEIP